MHIPLRVRWWSIAGGAVLLAACVQPTLKRVDVDPALAARETQLQQEMAVRAFAADQMRLIRINHRVSAGASAFCGSDVGWGIGVFAWNIASVDRSARGLVTKALGLTAALTVLDVAPDSPAEVAGLRKGDVIRSIADVPIPESDEALERATSVIASNAYKPSGVPMVVLREGQEATLSVRPVKVCRIPVELQQQDEVQAYTDGKTIFVTQGLMRFVGGDDELALVFAHELSHTLLDHIEARQQNALAGGAIGLVFDVLAAAAGVDTQAGFTKLGMEQGALAYSPEFEAEADYMALYILARAGYDTHNAANFFRRLATIDPNSIAYARTHPTTVERVLALEQVAGEIERKRLAGLPLVPDTAEGVDKPPMAIAAALPAESPVASTAALAPQIPQTPEGGMVWRAASEADACGKPWAIAVAVAGPRVNGTLVRGRASYDLQGMVDATGHMPKGEAGKSLASSTTPGPRLIGVEAAFAEKAVDGAFWIESGSERSCETRFTLRRAEH